MVAVKLFRNRSGERTFRRLDEGNGIRLEETIQDLIIIGFSGTFDGDVIINGDLTVNGTTTTINSTTHDINDNIIVLNEGEVGAGVVTLGTQSGFEVDRGSFDNVRWIWDEPTDKFRGEFVTSGLIAAVEVDQLMFTDHGSNAQMWSIEEDSSSATNALTFDYAGVERLRIVPSGDFAIDGNNVVLSFASGGEAAVNNVEIVHATTGLGPIIRSVGADSNIDLNISSKGTGTIFLNSTTDVDVLAFRDHGANSQQWTLEEDSSGSNTNALTFDYSGSERLRITPDGKVDGRDLAVDGTKLDTIETNAKDDQTAAEILAALLTVDGAGTLLDADFLDGLDSTAFLQNIVEDLNPRLGADLDLNLFDFIEDGNVILSFESAGELAVNWIDVENALTGLGPTIRSVGSDTNVDLNISAKGTGIINLGSGGVKLNANLDANGNSIIQGGNIVLSFASPSEFAVNWIDVENADTGLGPTITVKGPDTNVDFNIEAKGLGRVNVTNDSAVAGAFVNDALDTLDVAVTTIQGLHYLGAFTVAGLPAPAGATNRLALATDAGGGRTLVISNGSDWHVFAVEGAIVTV